MFSIIIPLYNKEKYIFQTLQSVLNQTFQEFEIIIVDDGSTDSSLLETKKINDTRVRIVTQKNAGVSAARNRGLKEAKYDLIAFLDADDDWLPNHLEEIIKLKNEFAGCKVFATNYKIIDSNKTERFPINTTVLNIDGERGILNDYFDSATKTAPPLWSSAIAVDKKTFNEIGNFPVGIRLGEDLLVWALLADKYDTAYSKNITAIYNFKAYTELLDDEPMPDSNDTVWDTLKEIYKVTDKNKKSLKKYISLWHRMRANLYINNKKRLLAFSELLKALYYNPFSFKNYVILILCSLPHELRYWISYKRFEHQQKSLS